jgi:hypothetical protein
MIWPGPATRPADLPRITGKVRRSPLSGNSNPFGSCINSPSLWRESSGENTVWRDGRHPFRILLLPSARLMVGRFSCGIHYCANYRNFTGPGGRARTDTPLAGNRILSPKGTPRLAPHGPSKTSLSRGFCTFPCSETPSRPASTLGGLSSKLSPLAKVCRPALGPHDCTTGREKRQR